MDVIDFKALADNSIDVIIRCDADLVATYVSPSVSQLLGVAPEDMIGKPHHGFIAPEDLAKIGRIAADHIAGRTESMASFRMVRADRTLVWVEGGARMFKDAVTGEINFVVIVRDISERKALEAKLAMMALTDGVRQPDGDRIQLTSPEPRRPERRPHRARMTRLVN